MKSLNLNDTRPDDDGLAAGLTGRFPELNSLSVTGTRVTDAFIISLDRRPALSWLNLQGTAVTPAGLRRLAKLPNLRTLRVYGMEMTEQEAQDLRALMPNVDLDW